MKFFSVARAMMALNIFRIVTSDPFTCSIVNNQSFPDGDGDWRSLACNGDCSKLAGTQLSEIFTSPDAGSTWNILVPPLNYTNGWSGMSSSATGAMLAASSDDCCDSFNDPKGIVVISNDYGVT